MHECDYLKYFGFTSSAYKSLKMFTGSIPRLSSMARAGRIKSDATEIDWTVTSSASREWSIDYFIAYLVYIWLNPAKELNSFNLHAICDHKATHPNFSLGPFFGTSSHKSLPPFQR